MRARLRLPRPTLTGALALALAAGFIAWLAAREGGGSTRPAALPQAAAPERAPPPDARPAASLGPVVLAEPGLRALARSLGGPVYWVGPEPGRRYEFRRTEEGNVFLRYLPPGVRAGDEGAYRAVGTYPFPGAYAATRALSREVGTVWRRVAGGWLAVYRRSRPTSIYLARPGLDYQVEVFDPSPAVARRLVEAGRLRPLR